MFFISIIILLITFPGLLYVKTKNTKFESKIQDKQYLAFIRAITLMSFGAFLNGYGNYPSPFTFWPKGNQNAVLIGAQLVHLILTVYNVYLLVKLYRFMKARNYLIKE